ncbi:hypothetical protein L2E69_03845 [Planktothrix agardhii 1806]|jgi:hypothetical protein|uniref:Uncharacterized protein n=1 Tax=Planktothrix agardhii (strain NIVA-CYA 126/8) TaxID=388467 RepID=A0A073CEJ9_PLAA1|nr:MULTISPECIES: hypothetical protein [Planktothrix]MCF3607945.1 hypothetical protein [Planktothrix agardhii 1033]KEI66103.1 hypothetical protein A19Y_0979 [Planktothrix agardhii NIVA-CYA 126/8]MCB8763103.1 hypothetical protein [Planktothrix agardhii 1809]MCB8776751.1 hypothetical protein [Planktothrix agardhii 1031]MCB8781183.1 hypothetical protein [Planktothrix agardhii 1808]
MNEQLLLNKWQKLKLEDQERVLAFIDAIDPEKPEEKLSETTESLYKPQTQLGKNLWEIRQKIIKDPNTKLLDLDDIEAELDEIRSKNK